MWSPNYSGIYSRDLYFGGEHRNFPSLTPEFLKCTQEQQYWKTSGFTWPDIDYNWPFHRVESDNLYQTLHKSCNHNISHLHDCSIFTCYPDVHLGRFIVQQHVMESCDGIEQHCIHRRGKQADQVGDAPTIIDRQEPLAVKLKENFITILYMCNIEMFMNRKFLGLTTRTSLFQENTSLHWAGWGQRKIEMGQKGRN